MGPHISALNSGETSPGGVTSASRNDSHCASPETAWRSISGYSLTKLTSVSGTVCILHLTAVWWRGIRMAPFYRRERRGSAQRWLFRGCRTVKASRACACHHYPYCFLEVASGSLLGSLSASWEACTSSTLQTTQTQWLWSLHLRHLPRSGWCCSGWYPISHSQMSLLISQTLN